MHCVSKTFLIRNLEHNLPLLASRFPGLYEILHFADYGTEGLLNMVPLSYTLNFALKRSDVLTLSVNGKNVHSKYDPLQEAEKMYDRLKQTRSNKHMNFCFFGLGLGYVTELFIRENKKVGIAVIEPDIFIFILFLASRKLDSFFSHNSLILIPASPASETLSILENLKLNTHNSFYLAPSLEVSAAWLKEFKVLQERGEKKYALNYNTLKKFYIRWLKNFIKNIDSSLSTDGVSVLKNIASSFPAVVIAAGPSLDAQLPVISKVQDELIIIAVDTSLKAVLNNGIVPDFVVLMDGQYLNYLHIAGIPSSIESPMKAPILITEAAVYPQVFRERFSNFYLASSFFPLGRYIEDFIEMKGHLVAGGSVATTAWDFARFIGCSAIIMAGLDLAFTKKKTHASLCHFEMEALMMSDRFNTIESANYQMLDVKNTCIKEGYEGDVLTDSKMIMFAWWFESKIAETGIATYNLLANGLKIPNMPSINKEEFFKIVSKKTVDEKISKKKIIDNILKKGENNRNIKEEKSALNRIFNKIYFQFKHMISIINEIIPLIDLLINSFNANTQNYEDIVNIIHKIEICNDKMKKCELYKTGGFDVVVRVIEKEISNLENEASDNISIVFAQKIAKHYNILCHLLEESRRITQGVLG